MAELVGLIAAGGLLIEALTRWLRWRLQREAARHEFNSITRWGKRRW